MAYSLNQKGYRKAKQLINNGKISTQSWSKPNLSDFENIEEYASYHLAYNPEGDKNVASTYHYPFGKNGLIYKNAVANIKSRAKSNNETKIYDAASKLFEAIQKEMEKQENQYFIHTIFRYDKVFKRNKKKIPGISYMGE